MQPHEAVFGFAYDVHRMGDIVSQRRAKCGGDWAMIDFTFEMTSIHHDLLKFTFVHILDRP
ncbi:hypothetical protein ACLF3G_16940 [Falsiroseomonas sp. HC035]|uniref:hypothetical protein n=1 Tax=Falsiroseomonas sp. HC035 TaxID=3390999 RepID=UPI003D31E918